MTQSPKQSVPRARSKSPRTALVDITLVVDRSGSMQAIRDDAEGGVNAFIADQAAQEGEAQLTLVQFDSEYEVLARAMPIRKAPVYRLVPRSQTALLDAIGRAIHETAARLTAMPDDARPGLVVFVVMTDGAENSSKEYSQVAVRGLIRRYERDHGWHFTFLAAGLAAEGEMRALDVEPGSVVNVSPDDIDECYAATSDKVSRMRNEHAQGKRVNNAFTDEERSRSRDHSE